jgi:hypothetical protein
MGKKDLWTDGFRTAEVFRSSYSIGSRYSLLGSRACYKIRGASFGINGFVARADAHALLASKGFAPISKGV